MTLIYLSPQPTALHARHMYIPLFSILAVKLLLVSGRFSLFSSNLALGDDMVYSTVGSIPAMVATVKLLVIGVK